VPIERAAVDRPYFSGKHHRHGVNVQVLADSRGQLLWASPALPGAVHDLAAARGHHIPELLAKHGLAAYGDAAYQGAGPHIAVPTPSASFRPSRSSHNEDEKRSMARSP
jgi:DDE superfamily endonuclease